ncbi:xylulokinase [Erwinia typographi]|nr:FGGY family carbohydrate kinase [Erwinia typographi]
MKSSVVLTLDIGTTSSKLVLIDKLGHKLFSDKASYPLYFPSPGHVEQDPWEIWRKICEMLARLFSEAGQTYCIEAVAISSQISAHFLVAADGEPLTRVISWMDSRASQEAKELVETFSRTELHDELGMDMLVGPAFIAPKLKWLARHEPAQLSRAHHLVQLKEYVIWQLTGVWRSDLTSLKGIVNQRTQVLSAKLLKWAGVSAQIIPPHDNPWAVAGTLTPAAAANLNLPEGIPVILGWNDLNAAIMGTIGIPRTCCGFDITGTSEHIGIVSSESLNAAPEGINCLPFVDDVSLSYGVTSSGGQALQWYMENIAVSKNYVDIERHVNRVPAGAEKLIFLPYINGERNPWWNPNAQGVFFGMRAHHNKDHMTRAVLEGVGFALKASAVRLETLPEQFVVSGGASALDIWNQIKADILGVPFCKLNTTEAGCLGVAILAAYALGWYDSLATASENMIRTAKVFMPNEANHAMYNRKFEIYLSLYDALRDVFDANIHQLEEAE